MPPKSTEVITQCLGSLRIGHKTVLLALTCFDMPNVYQKVFVSIALGNVHIHLMPAEHGKPQTKL